MQIKTSQNLMSIWIRINRYLACVCAQSCPALCYPMDCSSTGFSVHGSFQAAYWSGLPCAPPGDLPDSGTEHTSSVSPALQTDSLLLEPTDALRQYNVAVKSTFLSCRRFQTSGDTQFLIFKGIKIVLHLQWVGGVSLTFIPFT